MTSASQRLLNLSAQFVSRTTLATVSHWPTLRALLLAQASVLNRPINGVEESDVVGAPVRTLRMVPQDASNRLLLFIHGGGFTIGSPISHKWLAARLAAGLGGEAWLPTYRLAPEHPFPAAPEDVLAAYRHALEVFAPERIVVAGDSAGGTLALGLMPMAAAQGLPLPAALGLLSPLTDLTFTSDFVETFGDRDRLLPKAFGRRAIDAYLAGQDPKDPAISPLFADLSMVPPTLVQVANEEALLDDTLRLEGKIPEITIDRWDDVFHVWQLKAGLSPEADEAVARMAEFLGAYLP
ncbi:MAG: alpha/beta hydrolase [Pseudomonadota bacterium]